MFNSKFKIKRKIIHKKENKLNGHSIRIKMVSLKKRNKIMD